MATAGNPDLKGIEFQLELRRTALRNTVRQHLHQSDDPKIMAFVNHMAEVDDWVEADILNDIDIAQCNLELAELRAVDAALSRVKAGTYGTCVDCSDAISLDRLHASPVAERCIECQERFERTGAVAPGISGRR